MSQRLIRPTPERQAETVWAIQAGCEGRWHTCTKDYSDRSEALARPAWFRAPAAPSVEYRLARVTTSVTVAIEEA